MCVQGHIQLPLIFYKASMDTEIRKIMKKFFKSLQPTNAYLGIGEEESFILLRMMYLPSTPFTAWKQIWHW